MDVLKMNVDNFERFFTHVLVVFESYGIDIIDIKKFAVVWVMFVIICAVSSILLRAKRAYGFLFISRFNKMDNKERSVVVPKPPRKEERIRTLNQLLDMKCEQESMNNDPKSRVMMDYRKKLRELHIAADKCNRRENVMKCIDIVSQYPPLVNVKCPTTGFTPFHRVCCHRNSCLISFMLSHGADPSIRTKNDENAMCLLIRSYLQNPRAVDFSSLKILQEAGCYLDRRDKWYRIFLDTATFLGNKALSTWIIENSAAKITKQNSFP